MNCRIEKVLTRLTRQTWKEALSRLWALEEGGGHESIDVVDDAGEVGHACIFIDGAGAWCDRKGTPDPAEPVRQVETQPATENPQTGRGDREANRCPIISGVTQTSSTATPAGKPLRTAFWCN